MTDIDGPSQPKHGQAEPALPLGMSTDPVVRTALLVRRIRALGTELRDIPGPKRDLIVKMWSRGDTPAEISRAAALPLARIQRILGLNVTEPALPARGGGSCDLAG